MKQHALGTYKSLAHYFSMATAIAPDLYKATLVTGSIAVGAAYLDANINKEESFTCDYATNVIEDASYEANPYLELFVQENCIPQVK